MKQTDLRKLTLTGIFVAVSVVGSLFSVPVFGAKCAPVQHLMNIMGAVFLGPGYAVAAAFLTSVIRNAFGIGTFLAFPGSMCGALLSGIMYRYFKKLPYAYAGEVAGTGILGGLLAYPVAAGLMGSEAAVFTFVIPFLISTGAGTILAVILVGGLKRSGIIERLLAERHLCGE